MTTVIESDVEEAALGWQIAYGPDIGPDSPRAKRDNYGQPVLERRMRDALIQLNLSLPVSAFDDALRKLIQPGGDTGGPQSLLSQNAGQRRYVCVSGR